MKETESKSVRIFMCEFCSPHEIKDLEILISTTEGFRAGHILTWTSFLDMSQKWMNLQKFSRKTWIGHVFVSSEHGINKSGGEDHRVRRNWFEKDMSSSIFSLGKKDKKQTCLPFLVIFKIHQNWVISKRSSYRSWEIYIPIKRQEHPIHITTTLTYSQKNATTPTSILRTIRPIYLPHPTPSSPHSSFPPSHKPWPQSPPQTV